MGAYLQHSTEHNAALVGSVEAPPACKARACNPYLS